MIIKFRNGEELKVDINIDMKLLMKLLNNESSDTKFVAFTQPELILNLSEIQYIKGLE